MDWAERQYHALRVALGLYFTLYLGTSFTDAPMLLGRDGIIQSPAWNPGHGIPFPNVFHLFGSAFQVQLVFAVGGAAAAMLFLNRFARGASLLLWFVMASILHRNNFLWTPVAPYLNWLLLAVAITRPPTGSSAWRFPRILAQGGRVLVAFSYSVAGWAKLLSPSWQDGTAMAHILRCLCFKNTPLVKLFLAFPSAGLATLTYFVLALELLYFPAVFSRRGRLAMWWGVTVMHGLLLFSFRSLEVPFGMLIVQIFTWDPDWVSRPFWAKIRRNSSSIEARG